MSGAFSRNIAPLIGRLKPYRKSLIFAVIFLSLGSAVNLLFPEILRQVLNDVHFGYFITHPWRVGSFLAALFTFQAVCFYYRSYLFNSVGQGFARDLRAEVFSAVLNRDLQFFESSKVQGLTSTLITDVSQVQSTISSNLSVFIRYSIQVLLGIVLMFVISPFLSALLLLTLPIVILAGFVLGKRLKKLSKAQQESLAGCQGQADEALLGVKLVKSMNAESWLKTRFNLALAENFRLGLARYKFSAFFTSFVSLLINVCLVVILVIGVSLVADSKLGLGDFTAFVLYGVIVAVSFAFLSQTSGELLQALGSFERVLQLLNFAPESTHGSIQPKTLKRSITFKDIEFSYPSRPDQQVLSRINFEIELGKSVALVGPSGSGKSTIVNLLLGFYQPDRGEITWDDISLAKLDPVGLRSRIIVVPQETVLFSGSLKDNICFGLDNISDTRINEACENADLSAFIKELPNGLDTYVGPRGVALSGGQRQRVGLARAFLRDADLLILDESTSALDSLTEARIQAALLRLRSGKTTLIIAHRLATVKEADQVIVIEKGIVAQKGSHESLRVLPGIYRTFVEKQQIN